MAQAIRGLTVAANQHSVAVVFETPLVTGPSVTANEDWCAETSFGKPQLRFHGVTCVAPSHGHRPSGDS